MLSLIHSDARALFPNTTKQNPILNRTSLVEKALEGLVDLLGENILIPTYAYDFSKTGVFDVQRTKSDLGSISNAVINLPNWNREPTPIFSHASNKFQPELVTSPFGAGSIFSRLRSEGGRIAFMGVGLNSMTFIHHVEHAAAVPYRYQKTLKGLVRTSTMEFNHELDLFVRPPGDLVEYDFEKLEALLRVSKTLREIGPRSFFIGASDAFEIIFDELSKDPLWLLSKSSGDKVKAVLDTLGTRFQMSDFE